MKQWLFRLVVVAALVALGIWVWHILFPSQEQIIRKRLAELAQAASFSGNEAPLAKAANSQKLTTFCAADVEIALDVPGRSLQTLSGRDELRAAALGARSMLSGLKVEFLDPIVSVASDKQTAAVNLTARGKIPGEKDILVQELTFTFKLVEGDWLINKIETVRTLR